MRRGGSATERRLSEARRLREGGGVEALEEQIGARLREDYRSFLLDHDGRQPEDNEFSIPEADNASGVNQLLSVKEILGEIESYGERLPTGVIPIAFAEGGNLVVLAVEDGRVMFWDHELEDADPFFRLSATFGAFWQALEKFDPTSARLKPGQVKDARIDPDLLE